MGNRGGLMKRESARARKLATGAAKVLAVLAFGLAGGVWLAGDLGSLGPSLPPATLAKLGISSLERPGVALAPATAAVGPNPGLSLPTVDTRLDLARGRARAARTVPVRPAKPVTPAPRIPGGRWGSAPPVTIETEQGRVY